MTSSNATDDAASCHFGLEMMPEKELEKAVEKDHYVQRLQDALDRCGSDDPHRHAHNLEAARRYARKMIAYTHLRIEAINTRKPTWIKEGYRMLSDSATDSLLRQAGCALAHPGWTILMPDIDLPVPIQEEGGHIEERDIYFGYEGLPGGRRRHGRYD